ncbi:TetR/AcrR family transcriptional regulator [Nocardia miyunensis]|uniref:TetR/AcrR family transcriptional regulator n=1 Tax=Nocardia miyunensis TaxID=282684 RepID=UPI00082A2455|nr:TetR/AcrR family transcriptional regulator [Nocardia miyunensis]
MASKQDYFGAAFDLLSEQGYGALKQAPLCRRLGVTTGSFYHYFENWHDFTSQFLQHWLDERTTQLVELTQQHQDAAGQLETLLQFTLELPHRAEAAIRVWGKIDPDVEAVQQAVDIQRTQIMLQAAQTIFDDQQEALRYAQWGTYLLVGYQQLDAGDDIAPLEWVLRRLLAELNERWQSSNSAKATAPTG